MTASSFAFLRRWALPQPLSHLHVNGWGSRFAVALEDGTLVMLPTEDTGEDPTALPTHAGPLCTLTRDADGHAFLSGGTDGRLFLIDPGLAAPTPLYEDPNQPVTLIAATQEGLRAFVSGQTLHLLTPEGERACAPFVCPGPPAALAFGAAFLILACGEALFLFAKTSVTEPLQTLALPFPLRSFVINQAQTTLYVLLTDGSVTLVSLAAEGKTPLTLGPQLSAAKTATSTFLALASEDHFLLAGGGAQTVAWPISHDQPAPLYLGEPGDRAVSCIAPHPHDSMAAIGYEDGAIILAPLDGRKELVIFPPVARHGARVVGLVWNSDGDCLHAALANGHVFLFTLRSVSAFIRAQRP